MVSLSADGSKGLVPDGGLAVGVVGANLGPQSDKRLVALRLVKHLRPTIATIDDVVADSAKRCSCCPRYTLQLPLERGKINHKVECPLCILPLRSPLRSLRFSFAFSC